MQRRGNYDAGTVVDAKKVRLAKPRHAHGRTFDLTIADIMAKAGLTNLNANALTTYTSTTSRWDPATNTIKYANQRRQKNFLVGGTTYAADLIESARTNLLAAGTSEHFEKWTVGTGTPVVTTDTLACPNGEVVADTLTEGVGTGFHSVYQNITKAASSLAYAGSIYVKNKTGSREVTLELDDGTTTNGVSLRINPATGVLTSAPAAFGAGWAVNTTAGTGGYTIEDAGGGWYRITLVATSDTTTTVRFRVALYNAADSYAGNGTSAIYLWGADVNQATFSGTVGLNRNILLSSETLGTNWTASRGSIGSNTTADPITGNLTADTFTEDNTATNTHALIQAITKPSSTAIQYTYSVYLKASGRSWVLVRLTGTSDTNGKGVYFDVTNGVKGSTDTTGAGFTLDNSTITAVGGGWWRCSITVTSDTTANIRPGLLSANADNGKTYTGTSTACYIAWGAHLEYGPTVTQYWATTTSVGQRTADVLLSSLTSITDARTNLLTYSEQFDNAAWVKTRSTITANATTDPNGNSYADKLVEDATAASSHVVLQSVTKAASSLQYFVSCYAKAGERTKLRMHTYNNAGTNGCWADYDLLSGAASGLTTFGSGWTLNAATSYNVGNGWYELVLDITTDTDTKLKQQFSLLNSSGAITYDGDAASGAYLFGAQVQQAASLGDYMPVGGTAITTTQTGLSRTTGTLVSIVMPRNWMGDQDGATVWRLWVGNDSQPSATRRGNASVTPVILRGDTAGSEGPTGTSWSPVNGALLQSTMTWSPSAVTGYNAGVPNGSADTILAAPFDAVTSLSIGASSTGTTAFFGYVLCLYSHRQILEAAVLALLAANSSVP